MAKKVLTQIKLQATGGAASPAPPVGPALGQHGINIMEFVKAFNAQTQGDMGVTNFVGASSEPVPLTQPEVDRLLHREVAKQVATKAQFQIGESVKVISGPLSDFSGEISEINQDASKLKVLVSIFGRETPVEVGFDQVKKI